MPVAIVAGATGMLGREIVLELSRHPDEWPMIYAISRKQTPDFPSHVKHQHLDLTASASAMGSELSGLAEAGITHVFFAAYLAKSDEQELADVNGAMLQNFLSGLQASGGATQLRRIVLVTGAKQYGLHLGRPKLPMEEADPLITQAGWPPNFYYVQEQIVQKFCADTGGKCDWVVTFPNDVIGAAKNNFMNVATPLALYAIVSKELGQELVWPGSTNFYSMATCFTSASLHAQFCRWAAMEEKVSNQMFNVINGDVVMWESLWPRIAARYGLKVAPDQLVRKLEYESGEILLHKQPPLSLMADEMGLKGSPLIEQSKVVNRIALTKWSQRPEVKAAWAKIAARQGLDKTIWDKATWGFCDFELGRDFHILISQTKSRNFGFTGFQDTWEAFEAAWTEMEGWKELPKPET